MSGTPAFADISVYQSTSIDWHAYKAWSSAVDGIARVSLRSSYGTGFADDHYHAHRSAAEAAGIQIIHYHYGYPSVNSPEAEADWQFKVVGAIGANDVVMLDYEENEPQATADWAYRWLVRQEQNYGRLPIIYASDSYIRARLQDARLARFPLVLANWTYSPDARPPCPPPWKSYTYLQWSDKATVPGIPGAVDANVFLGGATTSTIELANFPMISQRDGDPNQNYDCVPASIAACLQWLTGKTYTARQIKDAVYGALYTGGTAASAYVDYCTAQGVTLAPVNGNGPALVTALRQQLASQHPCLITEPDPYAAGWTHVCAAYKCDATSITVMDPWIDAPVAKTDAEWASQLQDNQIWTLEKHMPIPQNWKDNGSTMTAPNGVPVVQGFRDHVLNAASWDAGNQPLETEYHADQVLLHNAVVGAGQRQMFRDSMLWYTQAAGVIQEQQMGLELDVAYKLIAQQQAEIAILKASQTQPNVADAITHIEAAQAAAGVVASELSKALPDLKQ